MSEKLYCEIKIIALLAACFFLPCTAWAREKNLLPTGSFETLQGWSSWPQATAAKFFTCDRTVYKVGKASVRISKDAIGDQCALYTFCPMKGNKTYRISFWFKTAGLLPDSADMKLLLGFNLKGGGNASAGWKAIPFPAGGAPDWKQFSTEITAPPNTDIAQFQLDAKGISGTIWLDGVTVVEQKEKKEQVSIGRTDTPPVIDGQDKDKCWRNAGVMTGFLDADYEGNPAATQTKVQLAYDDKNLYVFYKCMEPKVKYLAAEAKGKDGKVWEDDCAELFISPVFGKTYQFLVNSTGAFCDLEIDVDDRTMRGYKSNMSWDSSATVKSYIGKDYWSAEISIPFADLNSYPVINTSWRINFARERQVAKKSLHGTHSTYSRLIGKFYQPKRFSKLSFAKNSAVLTRASKIDFINPFVIKRPNPLYKELLTDKPGNYTIYMWDKNRLKYKQSKEIQDKFNDEEWEKEVIAQIEEQGQAGMMGNPLPWAKEERCMKYYKKYGMKRKCCTESSWAIKVAVKNGAEVFNKKAVEEKKARPQISLIDPAYVDGVIKEIIRCANKYKDKPYIWTIEGRDEPNFSFIQGKISEMGPKMKGWNNEVLNEYGFGKYPIPAPNDPSYWTHRETHPFQKIAFARWQSDKYANTKKRMYEALKKTAPELKYMSCQFAGMSGFSPFDYAIFGRYSDMVSIDPYASSGERREGRGIYNHGFATKFLTDLSEKPTITVVQAFHYAGYTPKPKDLREWVSQSLKNGASRIEFFDDCEKFRNPPLYKEILRISSVVTSMNRVNLPGNADTAIICSLDSEVAERTTSQCHADQIYTAYCILGEKTGSWFDFILDRQLVRGEKNLSRYKIVYLPLAKYMTEPAAEKIAEYVKNGGVLVIGDPEAFSYNIDGTSLSGYREKLCGVRLKEDTFKAEKIKIIALKQLNNKVYPILKQDSIYGKIHLAHSVDIISDKAEVIAEFPNGKAAVLENRYGKGKVIYFAANPFAPDLVLIDSKISEFFKVIQKKVGAQTDLPIWRFLLPAP